MDEIFICGPEEMIFLYKNFLEQKDISEKRIHFELFTTSGQKQVKSQKSKVRKLDRDHKAKITVK
jgi:ring-1,2-phenylacetyl-CoA epoxidase subunit PaaE